MSRFTCVCVLYPVVSVILDVNPVGYASTVMHLLIPCPFFDASSASSPLCLCTSIDQEC
jgi:hypothetical protein